MGNKKNVIKDKKAILLIAFIALALFGAALVTFVPKLSIWSRSFSNETSRYEYIKPGESVSISFYAPFDVLTGIKIDIESLDERDVVASTDAELTITDADGNNICSRNMSSVLEKDCSFDRVNLERNQLYVLTYSLKSITGDDQVGIGVTDLGYLAVEMRGSYNGAPAKGMFIVCYVLVAAIVMFYVWYYGEQDIKKTGLIDKVIFAVGICMALVFVNLFYDLFMIGRSGLMMQDAVMDGKLLHFYDYAYENELAKGSLLVHFEHFYSVITYLIIAVFLFPIRLLMNGNIGDSDLMSIIVLYLDFVVAILVLCSVKLTERICEVCDMPVEYRNSVKYIYAFSSVIISTMVASGQIDIIYVLIILLALPFYYSKKYKTFSLIMAFALSIKILPFMVFFPLILLVNKRIKDIFINTAISLSVTAVEKLLYSREIGYQAIGNMINEKYGFADRLFYSNIGVSLSLFIVTYAGICIWCYLKDIDTFNRKELLFNSMLVIFAIYGFFTAFVDLHSQWLVPLFMAFSYIVPFITPKRRILIVECIFEILVLLVSDMGVGMANMVENGLLALPNYAYDGISLTEAIKNVTPLAESILISLEAGVIICLVVCFAVRNPFRTNNNSCKDQDYVVDRALAVGRIFVLYGLLILSFWQYCFVG